MLTFERLRELNASRVKNWHKTPEQDWSTLEWAGAMAGEAGEAANVAKKLKRLDVGMNQKPYSRKELVSLLAEECADTLIYLDLLCHKEGIDLEAAVRSKFNAISLMYGFPERLV